MCTHVCVLTCVCMCVYVCMCVCVYVYTIHKFVKTKHACKLWHWCRKQHMWGFTYTMKDIYHLEIRLYRCMASVFNVKVCTHGKHFIQDLSPAFAFQCKVEGQPLSLYSLLTQCGVSDWSVEQLISARVGYYKRDLLHFTLVKHFLLGSLACGKHLVQDLHSMLTLQCLTGKVHTYIHKQKYRVPYIGRTYKWPLILTLTIGI